MKGFRFRGVHSSELGLGYIPKPSGITLGAPRFEQIETTVPNKPGGYYCGESVAVREFVLPCYFEDITLDAYEKIIYHFYRGSSGRLIFDDRPYIYYDVVISDVIEGDTYVHRNKNRPEDVYSATQSIKFKAFDPFGKMMKVSLDGFDEWGATSGSGILKTDDMPPAIRPENGTYLLYNPGTEPTYAIIRAAGAAPNGVIITNNTTGDVCSLLSLPSAPNHIEVDGEIGTVKILPADPDGFAFELHDMGYITLAPCLPYWRDVAASYKAGSNVITLHAFYGEDIVGRHIRLNGEWLKIIAERSGGEYIVSKNLPKAGMENTMITTMNEISVQGTDLSLTMLEIEYTPRTR